MFRIAIITASLMTAAACTPEGEGVNITVEGEGFQADSGLNAKLALVHIATNEVVASKHITIADDGLLRAVWRKRIVEPEQYRVDAFVDSDRNDTCEFGVDKTFSFDLEIRTEHVGFTFFPMSAGDPRGCLSFGGSTLAIAGRNMPPNQGVYAALVRVTDNAVLDVQSTATTDGAFELEWAGGVRPGSAYRVDWFVDTNYNQLCDAGTEEGPWTAAVGTIAGDPAAADITGSSLLVTVDGNDTPEPAACESFPGGV